MFNLMFAVIFYASGLSSGLILGYFILRSETNNIVKRSMEKEMDSQLNEILKNIEKANYVE